MQIQQALGAARARADQLPPLCLTALTLLPVAADRSSSVVQPYCMGSMRGEPSRMPSTRPAMASTYWMAAGTRRAREPRAGKVRSA